MLQIKQIVVALVMSLAMGMVFAGGDAVEGKEKSGICAGCHGTDGNSTTAIFPKLAGQYSTYLEKALHDYQTGARKDATMSGMAQPLSEQDIKDLAAYYAEQKGLTVVTER